MKAVIYKIINPKNRIYIGQTINYKLRIQYYKRIQCKNQIKLFNSFKKYGVDAHKFEIITECKESELNDLERYYQDLYSSTTRYGLNLRLTKSNDRSGTFSDESKKKMSIAKIGKKRSKEVCEAISIRMKKSASERDSSYYNNFKIANIGRKHTEEHRFKNSESKKGNTFRWGSKHNEISKLKMSKSRTGKKDTEITIERKRQSATKAWKIRKK